MTCSGTDEAQAKRFDKTTLNLPSTVACFGHLVGRIAGQAWRRLKGRAGGGGARARDHRT